MTDLSKSGIDGLIESPTAPRIVLQARTRLARFVTFSMTASAALCLDIALIVSISILTGISYHLISLHQTGPLDSFIGTGAITAALFSAILMARRAYEPHKLMDFPLQLRETTKVWLLALLILSIAVFSLKVSETFSRGATLAFVSIGWLSIVGSRWGTARLLTQTLADGGFAQRSTILVADEDQLDRSRVVAEMGRYGYTSQRVYKFRSSLFYTDEGRSRLSQMIGEIIELSRVTKIDCVFILVSWIDFAAIQNALAPLRKLSLPVYLLPDHNVSQILKRQFVNFGPTLAVELKRAPLNQTERICKRVLDCSLASLILILIAPFMVVVAALIKIDSSGPVFFMQTRNGFNGRPFRIFKFRTMSALEDGPCIRQATKNDPRVTNIGRVLRRTNVDELPQLFNVLAGDMSLVGPRPHASAHNSEYEQLIANYACRHHVKPGLTGWAQVNGFRGETRTVDLMQERVELDLWYIDNWSMWLDFKILVKTLCIGSQPTAY